MRLILLGPPGSGKGTQAALLCNRHHLEHIGTGDMLRAAARQRTPMGVRVQPYLEAGKLAPDDLVNGVIAELFRRADRPKKFVMDGYPRTLAQASAFDRVLNEQSLPLTAVVLLTVADEEIVRRLGGRWSCPRQGCMATYHTEHNPPRDPGVCDRCGTRLVQRNDDKPETVLRRLEVYHRDTAELIPYYEGQGLLHAVPGQGEIEAVYQSIERVLNIQAGEPC
jgi:adenylate kinase